MTTTYPDARFKPLGAQTQDRLTHHDIVCVHTMVGYLTSTDPFFRTYNGAGFDGVESHFGVGGKWGPDLGGDLDGAVWQWQDLDYTADANLDGNWHVLSIETADNAARPIEPWTDKQVDALVPLIAWLCRKYDIPPVLIPDTQPARRGLAYHAQGAAEHTVGEWWSTSPGKDCPTAVRIGQFKTLVIPRVQALLRGEGDDDMPTIEEFDALLDRRFPDTAGTGKTSITDRISERTRQTIAANTAYGLDVLRRKIDAVAGAVGAQADDERVILAAIAADPTTINLSAEQVDQLAGQYPQLDAAAVARAVRLDLAGALAETTP
jgi:hypothetical protein